MITRRPTIHDVAQAAGVSAPVVSTVLNGRFDSTIGASAETRERVRQAANELNYKPNIIGRSLADKKSYLIGLMLSQINASLVADVIRGVQDVAAQRRYSPLVSIHDGPQQESDEYDRCQDRQVDALIVDTFDAPADVANSKRYRALAEKGFPIIELFGNSIANIPKVNVDFQGDGRRAVEYLVELGHERIALVTHDGYQKKQHWASRLFSKGYQSAMTQSGLKSQIVTAPPVHNPGNALAYVESGRQAAARLVALPKRPQAVVCYGNRRAYGLLQGLKEAGVNIPKDISVVSFYEREVTALADPPLTSLVVAAQRAGQMAAQLIFSMLDSKPLEQEQQNLTVPSEWVLLGSSTRPARPKKSRAAAGKGF